MGGRQQGARQIDVLFFLADEQEPKDLADKAELILETANVLAWHAQDGREVKTFTHPINGIRKASTAPAFRLNQLALGIFQPGGNSILDGGHCILIQIRTQDVRQLVEIHEISFPWNTSCDIGSGAARRTGSAHEWALPV
jgi:hypothetical protein